VAFVVVFSRETIKDLEDIDIDKGYKWTLPIKIGGSWARGISSVLLVICSIIIAILPNTLFGVPFILISAFCLLFNRSLKASKLTLDLGIVMALVSMLLLD
jgi:4-hydroxybenzoate polyprenyltransferase